MRCPSADPVSRGGVELAPEAVEGGSALVVDAVELGALEAGVPDDGELGTGAVVAGVELDDAGSRGLASVEGDSSARSRGLTGAGCLGFRVALPGCVRAGVPVLDSAGEGSGSGRDAVEPDAALAGESEALAGGGVAAGTGGDGSATRPSSPTATVSGGRSAARQNG